MKIRKLAAKIDHALEHTSAVVLLGPRQVGKTTLALQIAQDRPSLYLDLENPEDLHKLQDPVSYLALHADKLVILDEVQRYPDLFMALRGIIDKRRQEGRGNGRFLILGSASHDLLRQTSESLAGRVVYLELTGFSPCEIESVDQLGVRQLWVRGGFPNSYEAATEAQSVLWRKSFITTYLERDIPQLGPRIPAATLRRFWTMLAHNQGECFNASKLAASLSIASVTASRYLDLMVDLLLVRRLEPWFGNTKKRLVKAPRTYVRDSGILHSLLQIGDYEAVLGHPIFGKSWEGFVIEQILGMLPFGITPFFYRTAAGAEIDLLLELGWQEYWAIEIKASNRPSLKKGFHLACDDLKVQRKIIIYAGEDRFPWDRETMVMSLPHFLQELESDKN